MVTIVPPGAGEALVEPNASEPETSLRSTLFQTQSCCCLPERMRIRLLYTFSRSIAAVACFRLTNVWRVIANTAASAGASCIRVG